jgi:phytoene dehydrogenase-like protein
VRDRWDVVVVGGGHNGLTAAAYLARAGRGVLVLERAGHVGGAAVSEVPFPGLDARLSRYAYLVSLLPREIVDDLGLDVRLARRRFASYTPDPADPGRGLLVDEADEAATRRSLARVGASGDVDGWTALSAGTARLARAVFPTLTRPLPTRAALRALIDDTALWRAMVERPLGDLITALLGSDLVRGVVATDGLIGTLTRPDDPALDANRCFLYHVIGNGTGHWDVPVGGMGTVAAALERAARRAGARIVTGAEVTAVDPAGRVTYVVGVEERTAAAAVVLANVAPWAVERLCPGAVPAATKPAGAQVKVNLLVSRLPALRDAAVPPESAFAGTLHVNECYSQLERAHDLAVAGEVPDHLPCEVYCHSLTDPTILSPALAASGAHTLTVFGLQVPGSDPAATDDAWRDRLQRSVLASLASVLAEPVEDLLLTDGAGRPCIETRTTVDLERALGMPGGHIFHGPLAWPFRDDAAGDTAARRWGVATAHPRVLLCGAGAVRGGGVSGIGGHNAAMAVLDEG